VVGTESGGVDETNAWSCGTNVTITEKELEELVTSQFQQQVQIKCHGFEGMAGDEFIEMILMAKKLCAILCQRFT